MWIPFTVDAFMGSFQSYNKAVFPFQLLLLAIGGIALAAAFSRRKNRNRVALFALGILWAWSGVVYVWVQFTQISPFNLLPGVITGALFVAQALLFFQAGLKQTIAIEVKFGLQGNVGVFFILYGLVIYPALSFFIGGREAALVLSLGIPCPTNIFTLGFSILAAKGLKPIYVIIPFLWSIVGITTALFLGVVQDMLMIAGALLLVFFMVVSQKQTTAV